MKRLTLPLFLLIASLTMGLTIAVHAQNQKKVTVVQTIIDEDGHKTVIKKRATSDGELVEILGDIPHDQVRSVDVEILHEDQDKAGEEPLIFIREGRKKIQIRGDQLDIQEMIERAHEKADEARAMARHHRKVIRGENEHGSYSYSYDYDYNYDYKHTAPEANSSKAFLGVYIGGGTSEGVRITGTVKGTGAEAAGLQGGDVITSMDGQSLAGQHSLSQVLHQMEPGQSVTIGYLRDGQEAFTEANLTRKGYRYSEKYEADPCQIFIGVYLSGHGPGGEGIVVRGVIRGTPAEQAAVQPGDVITAIDQVRVNTFGELRVERDKHQLGEYFTLSVLRDGMPMEIKAQFPTCQDEPEVDVEDLEEIELALEEIAEEEPIVEDEPNPAPTSLESPALELTNFKAYPNPTVNYIDLQFEGEPGPTTIQLVDAAGKVVYSEQLNRFDGYYNKRVKFEQTTPGNYFLQIRQGAKVKTQTIVVVPRV